MRCPIFEKTLPLALSEAEGLPSLPSVAVEILRLTDDEDATIDDLAKTISRDPALSARLLKLANSSLFNLGHPVTTLARACMVLGVRTVKTMSLSFSVVGDLRAGETGAFDFEAFWRRSLVAAVAGRAFLKRVGARNHDEAFLCGLLSHIGQLVIARAIPEDYAEVVAGAGGAWPSLALEERFLGFNHSDVSATLLEHWKLPPLVWLTIGYCFRPDELPHDAPEDVRELVRNMAIVGPLVSLLCDENKARPLEEVRRIASEEFSHEEEEIEGFVVEMEGALRETAQLLNFAPPKQGAHEEMVAAAREQLTERGGEGPAAPAEEEGKSGADPETGLPGPGAFRSSLERAVVARCRRPEPRALGLLLVALEDLEGLDPDARRAALAHAGRVLGRTARPGELAARAGAERLALLVPRTSPSHLGAAAERVRRALAAEPVGIGGAARAVEARFGGACMRMARYPKDATVLARVAEAELAKAALRRDRVSIRRGERLPRS